MESIDSHDKSHFRWCTFNVLAVSRNIFLNERLKLLGSMKVKSTTEKNQINSN